MLYHAIVVVVVCHLLDIWTIKGLIKFQALKLLRTNGLSSILLLSYIAHMSVVGGDRGAGARENRGREGYGRREKKGREAGSLRWREAGEKFKKFNFFLLLLTSSLRNEPNNVS